MSLAKRTFDAGFVVASILIGVFFGWNFAIYSVSDHPESSIVYFFVDFTTEVAGEATVTGSLMAIALVVGAFYKIFHKGK
jgi:hypothetical protein